MKKTFITLLATVLTVAALHAYRFLQVSSISGKVIPPDAVDFVWAINGSDTLRTTTTTGSFAFTLRPGTWKVIVDGKDTYKDAILEKVEVKEGKNTDVGEIRLQQ
jgi:hypothetical protein